MSSRPRTPSSTPWLGGLLALCVVAASGWWLWHSDIARQLRLAWWLQRQPAPTSLPVPVEGVAPARIADTWGAARSGGRQHQGVDIFASRGTAVLSATTGLVLRIADGGIGGRQVWILGPGGERHYYAHLDNWSPGLVRGMRVDPGTPVGIVGDTGNAKGTPPHLHYGIYGAGGARNPWPLLQAGGRGARAAAASPPR